MPLILEYMDQPDSGCLAFFGLADMIVIVLLDLIVPVQAVKFDCQFLFRNIDVQLGPGKRIPVGVTDVFLSDQVLHVVIQ